MVASKSKSSSSGGSSGGNNGSGSKGSKATTTTDVAQLPLVGETILKKRHDLDDLARKRAALEEIEPKRRSTRSIGKSRDGTTINKKKKFYVLKPETVFAHRRNQQNQHRRLLRVQKKGMQTRASNTPTVVTKKIPINDDDDDDDDNGDDTMDPMETETEVVRSEKMHEVSYQTNSVGANMVFVIRIRDSVATPKSILNILHNKLQLRHINDGVFIRYNDTTRSLLHSVEPYVVYGPINDSSIIHDLIIRRGHAKLNNNERVPISNNAMIEEEFQNNPKYNQNVDCSSILCIEDIVHEINTVGSAFDVITKDFLYPFQLSNSKSEYESRTLRMKETFAHGPITMDETTPQKRQQQYGDRGHMIHEYIQNVL